MNPTDTPQNACPHCWAERPPKDSLSDYPYTWVCGTSLHPDNSTSRSELCEARDAYCKAKRLQAEVERLRGQLQQAVEIAEVFKSELDEYHSVDRNCPDAAWHYPEGWERSEEAKDKLESLNKEIK